MSQEVGFACMYKEDALEQGRPETPSKSASFKSVGALETKQKGPPDKLALATLAQKTSLGGLWAVKKPQISTPKPCPLICSRQAH